MNIFRKKPEIESAVQSNIGLHRTGNEDNFYFNGTMANKNELSQGVLFKEIFDGKTQVYAVCDGVGGQARGEEASYLAASSLSELFGIERITPAHIFGFIKKINERCRSLAAGEDRPGSTLVTVIIQRNIASVVHIGDSRAYFMRDGDFKLLTRDHSQAQEYVDNGLITADKAATHPSAAILTQYLGMPGDPVPSFFEIKLKRNDTFLLCSDGLSDLVSEAEMAAALNGRKCTDACKDLTALALKRGGYDNITTMALRTNR